MAVEPRRGCGFRKVGNLYLVGGFGGMSCDRLPMPLTVCPCCGAGIKQARGWTWIDIAAIIKGNHRLPGCKCHPVCPLCHNVKEMGKAGLLWIGVQFYPSIAAFEAEARLLGVSRRITALPRGFELGKSWVLLAHPRGVLQTVTVNKAKDLFNGEPPTKYVPAIFRVWRPTGLERIYKESDKNSVAVKNDRERGITPVFVPDNDRDHQGSVYDKDEEDETSALFDNEEFLN